MYVQFWQSMVCIFDVFEACVGQDVFSGDYFICDVAPQGLLCCVCFNGWALIKVSLLSDVAYASHLFCSHESKIQCLCSICIEFFCFLWTHVIWSLLLHISVFMSLIATQVYTFTRHWKLQNWLCYFVWLSGWHLTAILNNIHNWTILKMSDDVFIFCHHVGSVMALCWCFCHC